MREQILDGIRSLLVLVLAPFFLAVLTSRSIYYYLFFPLPLPLAASAVPSFPVLALLFAVGGRAREGEGESRKETTPSRLTISIPLSETISGEQRLGALVVYNCDVDRGSYSGCIKGVVGRRRGMKQPHLRNENGGR